MMKRLIIFLILAMAGVLLVPMAGRADGSNPQIAAQLSPQRLDLLDKRGYFTPAFKKAVHDLVDARNEVVDAKAVQKKQEDDVPDLEKQVNEIEAKLKDLHSQLDALNSVDKTAFAELQAKMNDSSATLEQQRVLAQAFVWGYPLSPQQADAQKYLADVQKAIADKAKAEADAEAAKVAKHALLVQRAQAKQLNVSEWRDLLLTMSKEDLLKFMGKPSSANQDDWVYSGAWTTDAQTQQKVGLDVGFNGGRVINVTEAQ